MRHRETIRGTTRPTPTYTPGSAAALNEPDRSAKVSTLTERIRESYDAAPMTVRCGLEGCTFTFTGTAGDGRAAAEQHRDTDHPELADSIRAARLATTKAIKKAIWARRKAAGTATTDVETAPEGTGAVDAV